MTATTTEGDVRYGRAMLLVALGAVLAVALLLLIYS
jgi:hypothetical protein